MELFERIHWWSWKTWQKDKGEGEPPDFGKEINQSYSWVQTFRPMIKPEKLTEKFRTEKKRVTMGRKEFIHLPPLGNHGKFVPVLWMDWNRETDNLSLRVELYSLGDEGKVRGFGFRFENGEKDSDHDFFHASVNDFKSSPEIECPNWLPTTNPRIPLRADTAVALVICVMVSYYGKGMWSKNFADFDIPHASKGWMKELW